MTLKVIPVAIGLILKEDMVLMGKRTSGDFIDFWEFPGGKIEENESSYTALIREMHEELSIQVIEATEVIHIREQHPYAMFHLQIWHVKKYAGEIFANEQQELQWAHINQLQLLKIIPTNTPILQYLEQLTAKF